MIHTEEGDFVLFELSNKNKLIKGVRYYIKDYYTKKEIKCTEIYATFLEYLEPSFVLFRAHAYYSFYQDLTETIIHRCITKEEFYKKVKEKYDAKCLNIILKRLVDETFQSDFL
jgi:hypothetical protein